jgi:hypothetical protein
MPGAPEGQQPKRLQRSKLLYCRGKELTHRSRQPASSRAGGKVLRGWAPRSVSGSTAEGIAWIEDGIRDYRATGSMLRLPYFSQ